MIDLQQSEEGVRLPVRARAGGARNAITGIHNGALKVMVTQAPEKGKANQAIEKLLANSLSCQKSQLSLLTGHTSPNKTFLIVGFTLEQLSDRIQKLLEEN